MHNTTPSWDRYFLDIASVVAARSTCLKRNVGAIGFCQTMPFLADSYDKNPYDPEENIECGAIYFNDIYKRASGQNRRSFYVKGEDDNSTIVRFYDLLGEDSKIQLNSFQNINKALRTNLIENGTDNLKIDNSVIPFNLGHHSIETMKLYFID